ncbi:hypothetical protein Fmac_002546 [Flemingia macrophylla]|uniref:Gamma carbonic anhydrase n=1 Tax=Flemingia macrophylla TaxID=520843 RepID=A0ABD1NKB6_9FABA
MGTIGRAFYAVGFWIRETGQAIDRLGSRLQGNYLFQEQLSRHRPLMNVFDKGPAVHRDAFVAPSASLVGDVRVGPASSIWYGCVLRERNNVELFYVICGMSFGLVLLLGNETVTSLTKHSTAPLVINRNAQRRPHRHSDVNSVVIGSGTNIQDNSLVHVAKSNLNGKVLPTVIGDNVTVGHSAVLQGCTVEDEAFIGMGATLLDGVYVEKHAMVAAGALVRQNTRIPYGEVWGGNPARFLRKLTEDEMTFFSQSALNYSNLAQAHDAENAKKLDETEFVKVLHKKSARHGEEYAVLGGVQETPAELNLSDNVLLDKAPKA